MNGTTSPTDRRTFTSAADRVTVTVTLPYTEECERLSTAYYDAVGRRMTEDDGPADTKAKADEARLEKQLRDEGCWP